MKKTNPEMIDSENPEWTDRMFREAKPLEQSSLPEAFKKQIRRGRPSSNNHKTPVSIRLSSEVVAYFRSQGKGWQTKLDEVLKVHVANKQL